MDHSLVFADVDTRTAVQSTPATMVYNYKKADWQAMQSDMKNFKFSKDNT